MSKKTSKHRLVALFGSTHLAELGFVTRPLNANKTVNWAVGGMRPRKIPVRRNAIVNTKAFGWYLSAGGTYVPIGPKTTSRLAQLVVRMGGQQGLPQFIRNALKP